MVDDVDARCEGNPFFAEELVLAGGGASPGALPASLQEVLLARVVRLGRDTQQLLGVVAAAGPGVTGPLLAVVTGMGETELLDSLHEAVDQRLVLPEPGSRAGSARGGVVAPGFKPVRSERADGGGGEWLGRLGWRIQ